MNQKWYSCQIYVYPKKSTSISEAIKLINRTFCLYSVYGDRNNLNLRTVTFPNYYTDVNLGDWFYDAANLAYMLGFIEEDNSNIKNLIYYI